MIMHAAALIAVGTAGSIVGGPAEPYKETEMPFLGDAHG